MQRTMTPGKFRFTKVRDVKSPVRGTNLSAGIDFFVPKDFKPFVLLPHKDVLIPSGIKASFEKVCMLMAAEKSGVTSSAEAKAISNMDANNSYQSPTVLGAKIVDADYQGEIHIHIINVGNKPILIEPDKKIAQFILVPVLYCEIEEADSEKELFANESSSRGDKGFGKGTGEN